MPDAPQSLAFRRFVVADAVALEPWLAASGLAPPAHVRRSEWASRLANDPRVVALMVDAVDRGKRRPVGFARLDLGPDRSGELTLIVDPAQRRHGVGRGALEHILRVARNRSVRRLVAVVREDGAVAREFFLSCGFEPARAAVRGFDVLERWVHGAESQPPLEIVP